MICSIDKARSVKEVRGSEFFRVVGFSGCCVVQAKEGCF